MLRRRLELLLLAALLASGLFFCHSTGAPTPLHSTCSHNRRSSRARGDARMPRWLGQRVANRRAPGPAIDPYVRPEFAAEMRALQPTILAAARRHNRPELSDMSDDDFAV